GHPRLALLTVIKTWMSGPRPGMTNQNDWRIHVRVTKNANNIDACIRAAVQPHRRPRAGKSLEARYPRSQERCGLYRDGRQGRLCREARTESRATADKSRRDSDESADFGRDRQR